MVKGTLIYPVTLNYIVKFSGLLPHLIESLFWLFFTASNKELQSPEFKI